MASLRCTLHFILLNPILLLVVINICRCSSSTIGMSKYGVWMMDENQKNSVASECTNGHTARFNRNGRGYRVAC